MTAPKLGNRVDRLRHVQAGRLRLICLQAVRIPFGVGVICSYLVFMLWEFNDHKALFGWALITWGTIVFRAVLSQRLSRRELSNDEIDRWTKRMVAICCLNGIVGGSSGLLFFASSPLAEQAIMTMLLCCWAAGAMATSGALPLAFYAFLLPFLAPLAFSWSQSAMHGNVYTASLIVMFGIYLAIFVRDNARMITKSLLRRRKNMALIQLLNQRRRDAENENRSKSRLLAAASHDLRQPLNALSINSYLLRKIIDDPKSIELASEVDKSVRSLNTLFSGLLDISRLDAGMVVPNWSICDVRKILDEVARDHGPVAHAKGLMFSVQAQNEIVRTDPLLLGIVLRNLASNAIRYTDSGFVRIRTFPVEEHVAIEVSDTGVGILANEIPHIFEEFYQSSNRRRVGEEGVGLGLATVSRYVPLLECSIKVDSVIGKGSTFVLTVPRAYSRIEMVEVPQKSDVSQDFDLTGLSVLVLDDELDVRLALQRLMSDWGCNASLCSDPREALEIINWDGMSIDFVIADYRLRGLENGVDFLRRLQARHGPIPSLLVTADTAPDRLSEAVASGFPILHKPIEPDVLKSKISQMLSEAKDM